MTINKKILQEVITSVKTEAKSTKIQIYSRPAAAFFRYLDLTIPIFSRGAATAEILTDTVSKKHPELWEFISKEVPTTEPEKEHYLLEIDLSELDPAILKQAVQEVSAQEGRTITIYNPRLSSMFRYHRMIIPRYSISHEGAVLLEATLKERYPEAWEQIIKAIEEK